MTKSSRRTHAGAVVAHQGSDVLDLDAAFVARTEAVGGPMPIRWKGQLIAELPAELPLDVLAPVRNLDVDLALLIQEGLKLATTGGDDPGAANAQAIESAGMLAQMLVTNPELPASLFVAAEQMGRALLGDSGYEAFLAGRPSGQDVMLLLRTCFRRYGVSLGEALRSSDSSTDGTTSSSTSTSTSDSTSAESGSVPELQAS